MKFFKNKHPPFYVSKNTKLDFRWRGSLPSPTGKTLHNDILPHSRIPYHTIMHPTIIPYHDVHRECGKVSRGCFGGKLSAPSKIDYFAVH